MLIKRILKDKKGQSLVELAILLPVLLLILMGIFEFGRVMNAYLIITHASREGARTASVGYDDTVIVQKINESSSSLDISKLTVNISPEITIRRRGTAVTVTVGYDMDIIVPIIEILVPDPLHIETQTIMRVE